MKTVSALFGSSRLSDQTCLIGILIGFAVLFLSLNLKHTGMLDPITVDLLLYAGIFRLLWLKRDRLTPEADSASTLCGLALIGFTLFRSLALFSFESIFLRLAPVLAFAGVALLATGFSRLHQYWRESLILALMAIPIHYAQIGVQMVVPVERVIAKLAAFLLHYAGFDVSQQGTEVVLPTGGVEVFLGCTGTDMTLVLLKLALAFAIVFPLGVLSRLGVPLAAIIIGVLLSGVRVVVMVLCVSDKTRFEFWHGPTGAQIFSTVSIVLLFFLCRFTTRPRRWEVAADAS